MQKVQYGEEYEKWKTRAEQVKIEVIHSKVQGELRQKEEERKKRTEEWAKLSK